MHLSTGAGAEPFLRDLNKPLLHKCIPPQLFWPERWAWGMQCKSSLCVFHNFQVPSSLPFFPLAKLNMEHKKELGIRLCFGLGNCSEAVLSSYAKRPLYNRAMVTSLRTVRRGRLEAALSHCRELKYIYIYIDIKNNFSVFQFPDSWTQEPRSVITFLQTVSHPCSLATALPVCHVPWPICTMFTFREHLLGTAVLWHTHMHTQAPGKNSALCIHRNCLIFLCNAATSVV